MQLEDINLGILNRLLADKVHFAIYRKPYSNRIHLIIQKEKESSVLPCFDEMNSQKGFLLCPYQLSKQQPAVVIAPDIYLIGKDQINAFANDYMAKNTSDDDTCEYPYSEVSLQKETSIEEYRKMFSRFQAVVRAENIRKLVLSRVKILTRRHSDISQIFHKALEQLPHAFVYLAYTKQSGVWLGGTPELLVAQREGAYHTTALAGTQSVADVCRDDFMWDHKNIEEQAVVADYMRGLLSGFSLSFRESATHTVYAGNVAHLKTDFSTTSSIKNIPLGDFLRQIHPSPAVCGFPKREAFDFILQHETHSREFYSGFVGELNMDGMTDLYVNLRCMKILSPYYVLFAGGGILSGSECELEWEETEVKMHLMEGLLVHGKS